MWRVAGWLLLQAVLLQGIRMPAHASQLVRGELFLVKDPKPGVDATRRRIVVVGTEKAPGDGDTIVGDPRVTGATVQVVANSGEVRTQTETYPLPAAGWSRIPSNPSLPLVGYTYADSSPALYGPVRKAFISNKAGRFTVSMSIAGANGPGPPPHIRIVPPDPGTDGGAVLTINGGDSYCVTFGGAAGGHVANAPSTPPRNKIFRISNTGAAPTTEAGCVVTRPNIVVILTDDQRWDTLGTTHSPSAMPVMPHVMDDLAAHGVTFANAFLPTPLCTPSRVAFLTGAYAHHTGALNNGYIIPPAQEASTVATWLKAGGYRTGFFGKYVARAVSTPPPGWDEWQAFTVTGNYNYALANNGHPVTYGATDADFATDVLGQKVVDFIGVQDARPFFAVLAPYAPHVDGLGLPQPAPRHVGMFSGVPPFRPASYDEEDITDKPAALLPQEHRAMDPLGLFITYGSWMDVIRQYALEALQAVDDAVGDIVDAVDARGVADNTVIIFTSDNGLHWGEHRSWETKNVPYEESIRVPLVVRYPKLVPAAREATELVANIDLAPTIADLAGVAMLGQVDGQSMVPLLANQIFPWRSDLLFEAWATPAARFFGGVRTDQWKFVQYSDGETELYDLLNDPSESTNVSSEPANQAIKDALADRLVVLEQ